MIALCLGVSGQNRIPYGDISMNNLIYIILFAISLSLLLFFDYFKNKNPKFFKFLLFIITVLAVILMTDFI